MKCGVIGNWPDKQMSVSVLKAVLRRKITGSKDASIRKFCRQKLLLLTETQPQKTLELFLCQRRNARAGYAE